MAGISTPSWQLVYDAKLILMGEVYEVETMINHHEYEARRLESRKTMLQQIVDRLDEITDRYEEESREATATEEHGQLG